MLGTKKFNLPLRRSIQAENRYIWGLAKWRDTRKANIKHISKITTALEDSKHNSNITSLTGAVGGVAGGIVLGAGFIALPFTFGASAVLLITGGAVIGSAAVTGVGGTVADLIISSGKCKEAQIIVNRDAKVTSELHHLEKECEIVVENMGVALKNLKTNHPEEYQQLVGDVSPGFLNSMKKNISGGTFAISANKQFYRIARLARICSVSKSAVHLLDEMNPFSILNAGTKLDDVVEVGTQTGVLATTGAKVGFSFGVVFLILGLAADIASLYCNARLIHIHRGNRNNLRKDNGVDKRDLKSDEQKKNIGVLTKLKQKISHPFTKTYISDSAHKLQLHREKLLAELFAMETNPQLQEILVQCDCRECLKMNGEEKLHCCHHDNRYWDLLATIEALPTHNTPSLCITQHPAFAKIFLNAEELKKQLESEKQVVAEQPTQLCRQLRSSAYQMIKKKLNPEMPLPNCVRRAVIHTFQPEVEDVWKDTGDLGISIL